MVAKENNESGAGVLLGFIVVLVIILLLGAGAASYCYRMAERAKMVAEVARAEAERPAQARGAVLEQNRTEQLSSAQYFKHVVGVHRLSDEEINVLRPNTAGDADMAVVLKNFEADMASVNQLLPPDQQVSNYHDALVACRVLLEKDGD